MSGSSATSVANPIEKDPLERDVGGGGVGRKTDLSSGGNALTRWARGAETSLRHDMDRSDRGPATLIFR